jgi:protein involved in polysaccharide export with SLBB domain
MTPLADARAADQIVVDKYQLDPEDVIEISVWKEILGLNISLKRR